MVGFVELNIEAQTYFTYTNNMNIDDKLLELVAKRVNLSKFDNDWLDKYFDIKYEINDYIESMGYHKDSIMLHLCLYLNIEAEEYIWAEQTKVEINKLP